mgnify:CR=1 FL=1
MNAIELNLLTTLLVGTAMGIVPLAIGLFLGVWLTRQGGWLGQPKPLSGEQSERLVQTLLQWTNSLVGDVDECRKQMAAIGEGVLQGEIDVDQAPEAFVEMMSKMVEANGQMRQRLSFAEDALAQQARRIAETLNEARTDPLTGLPNRRMFDEELARRHAEFVRYGTEFSLLMFDIDHFKQFNDTHGHLAGDEVLRNIARVVGHTLRETDTLARLGGEEFAVILSSTVGRDSRAAAERAREAVAASTTEYNGNQLKVTVSTGLAQPQPGEEPTALYRRSDQAMYASKSAGRNCGHWHDGRRCIPLDKDAAAEQSQRFGNSEGELAQACDALRQRLLEVTAG